MTTETASMDGHYQLANDFLAIGEIGVAALLLKELIAARPHEGRAHRLLGVIAYHAGEDGPAAEHFAQAIRLDPENGDYYRDLAQVLSRMGRPPQFGLCFPRHRQARPGAGPPGEGARAQPTNG
jgi:Tfp pilus assembly protein PilF